MSMSNNQFPFGSNHAELYDFYPWEINHIKRMGVDSRRFDSEVVVNPWLPAQWLEWHYGIDRADRAAIALGHELACVNRTKAGILMQLRSIEKNDGHCWEDWETVREDAAEKLSLNSLTSNNGNDLLKKAMRELVDRGDCQHERLPNSNDGSILHAIARSELARMEKSLAKEFTRSHLSTPFYRKRGDKKLANQLATRSGLNEQQQNAVETALNNRISLISGVAGSGKSYVISVLHELHQRQRRRVTLCAPTGKAARRLEELTGTEACTIHRLLGFDGYNYRRNADDPLDTDVVIADEVSMMDTELLYHLFEALNMRRSIVTLVGDHNQLPPVGPGYPLRDLIEDDTVPRAELPEVIRQAGELKKNCTDILKGKIAETVISPDGIPIWKVETELGIEEDLSERIMELFSGELESMDYDIMRDVQVLIPRKGTTIGVDKVNVLLQQLLQNQRFGRNIDIQDTDNPNFFPGDKIIQTRNNYDLGQEGIMNGTIGKVISVSGNSMDVEFPDEIVRIKKQLWKDILLAYALTVHKTQGSEFPCVILVLHPSHKWKMHHRNLFYTGVTRAQKSVFILGTKTAIRNCAKTVDTQKWQTLLQYYMKQS